MQAVGAGSDVVPHPLNVRSEEMSIIFSAAHTTYFEAGILAFPNNRC